MNALHASSLFIFIYNASSNEKFQPYLGPKVSSIFTLSKYEENVLFGEK